MRWRSARRPWIPFFGGNANFSRKSLSDEVDVDDVEGRAFTTCICCFSDRTAVFKGAGIIGAAGWDDAGVFGVAVDAATEASKARLSTFPLEVIGRFAR